MRAVSHFTGESGGGKSSLDMNFGISKTATKRRVAEGQGGLDVCDPVTLARALNYKPLKKTVSYAITFSRQDAKDHIMNKSAKDARLQSHLTRHYIYDEDGMPTAVHIEEQSFLPVGGVQKMVMLEGSLIQRLFPRPCSSPPRSISPTRLSLHLQLSSHGLRRIADCRAGARRTKHERRLREKSKR